MIVIIRNAEVYTPEYAGKKDVLLAYDKILEIADCIEPWRDDLTGWPRLRVIVNAMTRMRFCTRDGVMDFRVKGEVSKAPEACLPWFDLPERRSADSVLVTGHWSALGLKISPNLLAIDSGCLWGGALTAIRLEDRAVFQVDCSPAEIRAW